MPIEQDIMLRQSKMEEIRKDYEDGLWVDISRFGNPRREDIKEHDKFNIKGQRKGKSVYDGTALGSLNTWADGMQGFLVSGSWFKSEMSNPQLNSIDDVRFWLQEYDRKMYSAFERSNFYSVLAEWFRDAGSIGTATMFTEEELGTDRAVHIVVHPREIWVAENQSGEVDTVHRKFMMTARAIVQKFGEENVSDMVKRNAEDNPNKEHEILHAVFPNKDKISGKRTSRNKEFRSIYLETKATKNVQAQNTENVSILRDSGFDINPYAVWRFRKSSDEIYGYSPMADALVEVMSLNQFGKTRIQYAHKTVAPSMNVPIEMRGRVRNKPNGNNYYDDPKRVISPIPLGGNYPVSLEETKALQKSVEDKFRVEFFRAFIGRQGEATATEIMAIKGEQAGLMSAQVDRLYIEGLRRIFDIVSNIEDKRGAFSVEQGMPPMPQEIAQSGGTINFVLTGPLRQAQRRITELNPIKETMLELEAAAALLGPEVLDVINKDELSEGIAEAGMLNQKFINSKEERAAIREARQAAIEQERQAQMALEAAKAVPGLGKAVEENSPLQAVGDAIG
jgi:hypothetical protein